MKLKGALKKEKEVHSSETLTFKHMNICSMELSRCLSFCLQVLAGGNKRPLKRRAFRNVSQVALEEQLGKYCKRVGHKVAFDLKGYTHITTTGAADVLSLYKLIPLLHPLVSSTAPKLHLLVSLNIDCLMFVIQGKPV